MNLAYYMLAFDHATDAFFDHLGLGEAYLADSNCSTFTLEAHITYERELMADAPMRFATQLLAHDARRLQDRKSVVSGKSGSVRLDLGGRRDIQKKTNKII